MFGLFKKKVQPTEDTNISIVEEFTDVTLIAEYFKKETGVTFEKQISILKSKLITFCRQRNIYTFTQLLETVKSNTTIKQELIDYLTTNETFFYREFKQIEELVSLIKKRTEPINILCAPSATGEEPYSIAIALLEAGVSASRFSIVGIDINTEALQKANRALYRERNIRNFSPEIRQRYFLQDGEQYALQNSVKSLVTFKQSNLFDSSFNLLGTFDYVFSRNMLIYFDKTTKLKAKKILEDMRKDPSQPVFFGHADLF